MPNDIFRPLDALAPHNIIANLATGGQYAELTPVDVGGDGPKKVGPKITPARAVRPGVGVAPPPKEEEEEEEKEGITPVGVTVVPGAVAPPTGPEREEIRIPQEITFKVTDEETGIGIPDAAIYYDELRPENAVGATDFTGTLRQRGIIPPGKHKIIVDALYYDLHEMDIYVSPPAGVGQKKTYEIKLKYLAEVEPEKPPVEPPPPEPYYPPYEPTPTPEYAPPVYEAPTYYPPEREPVYYPPAERAPAYPTLPGPPPVEYLQQLLLLPFTTIQTLLAAPPPAPPAPMGVGGRRK